MLWTLITPSINHHEQQELAYEGNAFHAYLSMPSSSFLWTNQGKYTVAVLMGEMGTSPKCRTAVVSLTAINRVIRLSLGDTLADLMTLV